MSNAMTLMRLQKFLSTAGFSSRRKAETFILAGRVRVNGVVVTELGSKVDPRTDRVEVDGESLRLEQPLIYIAVNKPRGVVTSCEQKNDRIILDLINIPERVYPVGRLDKDSSGLLLLTNDGRLHHCLSHPSFDHEKEYEVAVAEPIADGALAHLEKGLPMMGTKTRPARIKRLSPRKFRMVLQEGKNRQVRRMLRKVGHQVMDLKRIRVANIRLGDLAEGAWRYLNEREREELLKSL